MVYIGTSGFSYDDWKGYFYPEKIDKKDMLGYYTGAFNAVEINSTYYAIPGARTFESMERRTPPGFKFVVKAHKDMTHVDVPVLETFETFLRSIEPVRNSGKLGCVLAQYPWSFKAGSDSAAALRSFKGRVGDLPTVIEFRNAGWVNDDTFNLLRELDFGFCCVDEPRLEGLMPPVVKVTSDIGYARFHGRNAKKWWKFEELHERYDYLYSEEELREWVPKAEEIDSQAETTYLFFNNHFHGKSAQNARMFARMLGLPPVQSRGSGILNFEILNLNCGRRVAPLRGILNWGT